MADQPATSTVGDRPAPRGKIRRRVSADQPTDTT